MWSSDVDLHSHSTYSDGHHAVDEVARRMAAEGVRVWSLTDHDTTRGWEEAQTAAARHGMAFLAGVELTCQPALPARQAALRQGSWHLLAYLPGPLEAPRVKAFRAWVDGMTEARGPRMEAMVARLNELGLPVQASAVIARAQGAVGRPHLAEELVAMGAVDSVQEAFDVWIGNGKPGHVEQERPTVAEAVARCTAAGGFCSLAHPSYYDVETEALMDVLLRDGVAAVEAFHGSHADAYRHELWEAATRVGLSVTVGSDHHGPDHHPRPGHRPVITRSLPDAVRSLRPSA